jgi:hypothetical protein
MEHLHGTEAVIPLGDGNTIKAPIQIPEAPNLIQNEAGSDPELLAALEELQQELHKLRMEQQRQHNTSERTQREILLIEEKREVLGMPKERAD